MMNIILRIQRRWIESSKSPPGIIYSIAGTRNVIGIYTWREGLKDVLI